MSIYGELDPMPEHRTQFTFKGKREHIAEVNISNMAYPNHHIDIEIPHGSREHVIVPETVKRTFNLDFELTNKTRSIVNNLGRTLVKEKVLIFGSKQSDTIISMTLIRIFTLVKKNVKRSYFKVYNQLMV